MAAQNKQELEIARASLADLYERGQDAVGESWDDVRRELFRRKK